MKGLTNLVKVIDTIRLKLNRNLKILGLLPTFYDARTTSARDMLDELRVVGRPPRVQRDHPQHGQARRGATRRATDHVVRGFIRRRTNIPASSPGGGRPWPELISAPPPRRRLSEERELSPPSSACCPNDRHGSARRRSDDLRRSIDPNPDQPRLAFDQRHSDELAASVPRAWRCPDASSSFPRRRQAEMIAGGATLAGLASGR